MTNHEKYKQAFSKIHISEDFHLEVNKMKHTSKKQKFNQMVAGIAACVFLLGGSAMAYAADVGGIQRTIQLWIHGNQSEVTIDFDMNGRYDMEYLDSDGTAIEQSGGGIAFEDDGSERPLTQAELLDQLRRPEVIYEDDGTIWIYYYDQKIDITDKFDDNVCYATVSNGEEILYMTIEYQNDFSSSPHKYLSPSTLN